MSKGERKIIDGRYAQKSEIPWRYGAIVVAEDRVLSLEVMLARIDDSLFENDAARQAFVERMDPALSVRHATVMRIDRVFVFDSDVWILGDTQKGQSLAAVLADARQA